MDAAIEQLRVSEESEVVSKSIRDMQLGRDLGVNVLAIRRDGEMMFSPPADTAIRVDTEAYRELRAGKLDPQEAFLAGKIAVEGDMQKAMQLALAVLSPD
jgi:putative sterol carrier protein